MKKILLFLSLVFLCTSCYTYKVFPKEYRKLENHQPKRTAYVINDTLKKELKILKASELFTIVNDSTSADLKLRLYPLGKSYVCGQAMVPWMLLLGQLPITLPDRYYYKFDEMEKDNVTSRKIELKIAQKMWFWKMFVFNKRFEEKAGKALLGAYQEKGN